jgi:hypothetical protein
MSKYVSEGTQFYSQQFTSGPQSTSPPHVQSTLSISQNIPQVLNISSSNLSEKEKLIFIPSTKIQYLIIFVSFG